MAAGSHRIPHRVERMERNYATLRSRPSHRHAYALTRKSPRLAFPSQTPWDSFQKFVERIGPGSHSTRGPSTACSWPAAGKGNETNQATPALSVKNGSERGRQATSTGSSDNLGCAAQRPRPCQLRRGIERSAKIIVQIVAMIHLVAHLAVACRAATKHCSRERAVLVEVVVDTGR